LYVGVLIVVLKAKPITIRKTNVVNKAIPNDKLPASCTVKGLLEALKTSTEEVAVTTQSVVEAPVCVQVH